MGVYHYFTPGGTRPVWLPWSPWRAEGHLFLQWNICVLSLRYIQLATKGKILTTEKLFSQLALVRTQTSMSTVQNTWKLPWTYYSKVTFWSFKYLHLQNNIKKKNFASSEVFSKLFTVTSKITDIIKSLKLNKVSKLMIPLWCPFSWFQVQILIEIVFLFCDMLCQFVKFCYMVQHKKDFFLLKLSEWKLLTICFFIW